MFRRIPERRAEIGFKSGLSQPGWSRRTGGSHGPLSGGPGWRPAALGRARDWLRVQDGWWRCSASRKLARLSGWGGPGGLDSESLAPARDSQRPEAQSEAAQAATWQCVPPLPAPSRTNGNSVRVLRKTRRGRIQEASGGLGVGAGRPCLRRGSEALARSRRVTGTKLDLSAKIKLRDVLRRPWRTFRCATPCQSVTSTKW